MKVNGSTILEGERIVLVPYKREHVPRLVETTRELELVVIIVFLSQWVSRRHVLFDEELKFRSRSLTHHCNSTQYLINS